MNTDGKNGDEFTTAEFRTFRRKVELPQSSQRAQRTAHCETPRDKRLYSISIAYPFTVLDVIRVIPAEFRTFRRVIRGKEQFLFYHG